MRRFDLMVLVLILATALPGCVRIPRDQLEVNRYSIDIPDVESPADSTLPLVLMIPAFQVNAQQRGERILHRDEGHEMDFYYYHRWIVSPAKMLGDAMAANIADWHLVSSVVRSETGMVPTHELYGRLVTLFAENRKDAESAVFEADLTLLRVEPATFEKTTVFQKRYAIAVPRKNRKVESFVTAVNEIAEIWLRQVRADLEPVLREESGRRIGTN